MAALYTRSADRARLAREAIGKLSKVENENIYSRTSEFGAGGSGKNKNKSSD
jgi:hypothetical protein